MVASLGQGTIFSAAVDPSGEKVAIASTVGVAVYDMESQELEWFMESAAPVIDVDFYPNASQIAVIIRGEGISVVDVTSSKALYAIEIDEVLMDVEVSGDGLLLAAASFENTVYIWDAVSGQLIHTLEDAGQQLDFSSDGSKLAANAYEHFGIWDTSTGNNLADIQVNDGVVTDVDFSPDSLTFAAGDSNGIISLYDLGFSQPFARLNSRKPRINSLAFLSDGDRIVAVNQSAADHQPGTIDIWSISARAIQETHQSSLEKLYFHDVEAFPNRPRLVITEAFYSGYVDEFIGGGIEIVDLEDGPVSLPLAYLGINPTAAAFSPDGTQIAVAWSDGTYTLWDWQADRLPSLQFGDTGGPRAFDLAFSPDGRTLAAANDDGTLSIWSAESFSDPLFLSAHSEWARDVEFSSNSALMVSSSNDGSAIVWDITTWQQIRTIRHTTNGYPNPVFKAVFSPDGQMIATGSAERVEIHPVEGDSPASSIYAGYRIISGLVFSADGEEVAFTGNEDSDVYIWKIIPNELRTRKSLENAWDVQLIGAGSVLVSAWSDFVFWDFHTGEELFRTESPSPIGSIHPSADGKTLATISLDGVLRLWQVDAP